MTEQTSEAMIIKIVNVNWDHIKSRFDAAEWDSFVADCREAMAEYGSTPDLKKLEAKIKASLSKSGEGKSMLQVFKNTLDVAGVRFGRNAPKDTHPTKAVQNSVDELADKVEKENSSETKDDSQTKPAKNE